VKREREEKTLRVVKKNKMKKKLIENETTDTETNRIKEKEAIKSVKNILLKTSVDSKEEPNLKTKENNGTETESSKIKFKNILTAKECQKKDEFQIESFNIDSLISSYKQETNVDVEDPLLIFSDEDEEEEEKDTKVIETNQEVLDKEIAEDIAFKSNRFSRLFKKDRHDKEKVRSAIISKTEKKEEERASKILMPLMRVSISYFMEFSEQSRPFT
jgi:hypothetical protein